MSDATKTTRRRRESADLHVRTARQDGTVPKSATRKRPPGGSRKGRPNRVTRDARDAFTALLDANMDQVQGWLNRVANKNPARALEMFLRLAEYVVPRLSRLEVQQPPEPLPPVPTFGITFEFGGPGQEEPDIDASPLVVLPAPAAPHGEDCSDAEGMSLETRQSSEDTNLQGAILVRSARLEPPDERLVEREPLIVDQQTEQVASLRLFEQLGRPVPRDPFAGTIARDAAAGRRRAETEARIERENAEAREQQRLRDQRMRDQGWED